MANTDNEVTRESLGQVALGIFIVFLSLTFSCLLTRFLNSNEVSKFTDAMPVLDPTWIPPLSNKTNQFVERQWLFQQLISPLLLLGGFLLAGLIGRIACFFLLSIGFVLLARALSLRTSLLLLALVFYIPHQSIVAGEWIVNGVEPKVLSYAFAFMALSILVTPASSLLLPAFFLGVSTSFHPLVGLYASFSCGVMVLLMRCAEEYSLKDFISSVGAFLIGSIFAFQPILGHLRTTEPPIPLHGMLSSTYIYTYLRTPHHLVPSFWPTGWEARMAIHLGIIVGCYLLLRFTRLGAEDKKFLFSLRSVFIFAASSLIPFCLGLIISIYDKEGAYLKYYLFRFADVIIPFATYLFGTLVVERFLRRYPNIILRMLPVLVAGYFFFKPVPSFINATKRLQTFPVHSQEISKEWADLCLWVRAETDSNELFITNPRGSETFPWLARRPIVGTFKQVPLSGGLQQWYRSMTLLGDIQEPWDRTGFAMSNYLKSRYERHNTEYVKFLLKTFHANYFVTKANHSLDLPVAYRNSAYILYRNPGDKD